jgi:hypothetical protein
MPFFVGLFPFIFSFSLMSEVYGLLLSESRIIFVDSLKGGKLGSSFIVVDKEGFWKMEEGRDLGQ